MGAGSSERADYSMCVHRHAHAHAPWHAAPPNLPDAQAYKLGLPPGALASHSRNWVGCLIMMGGD